MYNFENIQITSVYREIKIKIL